MNRMIAANPESRILERIAAVVGYEGQNGDDMIAAVEAALGTQLPSESP